MPKGDDRVRARSLKEIVNEINYRRYKNGKPKLTPDQIAAALVKDKDLIINRFVKL